MKIIHAADLHLGAGKKGENIRNERFVVFRRILSLAQKEAADIIIFSGDFLEQDKIEQTELTEIFTLLERAERRIFISPGNHDPASTVSVYRRADLWPANVHIFIEPETVVLDDLHVTVSGAAFKNIYQRTSLLPLISETWYALVQDGLAQDDLAQDRAESVGEGSEAENESSDSASERERLSECVDSSESTYLHIACLHGEVSADGKSLYNPLSKKDIEASPFDYLALGHIHKPDLRLLNQGRCFYAYSGTPQALDHGDTGVRGVWLLQYKEKNLQTAEFIAVAKTVYLAAVVNLNKACNDEEVIQAVLAQLEEEEYRYRLEIENLHGREAFKADIVWNLELRGSTDLNYKIDQQNISAILLDKGIKLAEIKTKTNMAIDMEKLANEDSLRGVYYRNFQAKIKNSTGAEKEILTAGLEIGLNSFRPE